jgi:hypothetical protein
MCGQGKKWLGASCFGTLAEVDFQGAGSAALGSQGGWAWASTAPASFLTRHERPPVPPLYFEHG